MYFKLRQKGKFMQCIQKHKYLAIVENIFKNTAQTSSKHRLHRLLISFTGWAT